MPRKTIDLEKFPEIIDSPSARAWLKEALTQIGSGFHPDTPAEDYVVVSTGEKLFSAAHADWFNDQLASVHGMLSDPSADALHILQNALKLDVR